MSTATGTSTGTGAGADAGLRAERRARTFAAMERAGLDVLVLHRRDSVAYACGVERLWTAGTRPFSASGVLVADGRTVHLMSTWDEGVPQEIPFDDLYGMSWNPAILAGAIGALPGFAAARRIGVDGLSVGFASMARRLVPEAEIVPADDLVHEVRSVKLPGELDLLRAASAVAAGAVTAATTMLADGAAHADALKAALRAAAAQGVTIPSSAPVVTAHGDLVHVDVGVVVHDYEGGQGRTFGPAAALAAAGETHQALIAACRPGATGADLRAAASSAALDSWRVRGTGLGFEPPVVTADLGEAVTLREGMALSVETRHQGVHNRDLVHVGAATTDIL
jgi:Xaa-Pro aminopeptidase